MDIDAVTRAEKLSAFLTVTRSEAAYAYAWGSANGFIDRHDTCLLVLATPGRHEITLFEYMSDFQLWLASFYKVWSFKMMKAGLQLIGSESFFKEARATARSTHRKFTALGQSFPGPAKSLLRRFYRHFEDVKRLEEVQMREARAGIKALAGATGEEREAARKEFQELFGKLRGSGLPAADTIIKKDVLVTRVYAETGLEFPSDVLVRDFCTPPES